MPVPAITPLTDLPSIADPANFDPRADNLLTVQFPRLVTEINAAGAAMDAAIVAAQAAASVAINGTSSTSIAISTGSKNFTVLAGHSWSVGTWLMIASRANPSTHWFVAQVTAYSGTLLTVSVHSFGGSGSRADWDLSITAKPAGLATTTADGLMSAADKVKVNGAAPLASPALTGSPTAPTAAPGTNSTQLANTAFVAAALANLLGSSPAALDTVWELAAALGSDPNFSTTVINNLATKLADSGDTFTGGYTGTPAAIAFASAITMAVAGGHFRTLTNSGAFTLNAPSGTTTAYTIVIVVTNAASGAGALTASGFTKVHGTFATTANIVQTLVIEVYGSHKVLTIRSDA